jgi:hypothetical protein
MNKIKAKVYKDLFGYIAGALGLIVGLAWNDAVKSAIDYVFPMQNDGLSAKFIYALILTLVVVIVTFYISKALIEEEEK